MAAVQQRVEMKIEASSVPETAKQDAGAPGSCVHRKFVPAPIWTEAMLAALERGVTGGKWNSFFADLGLFSMLQAHKLACQSRCGNS
jgi:hypothetical protein